MLSFHSVSSGQSLDTKHIYGPTFSEGDPLKESLCDTPANSFHQAVKWVFNTSHLLQHLHRSLCQCEKSLFWYVIFFGPSTQQLQLMWENLEKPLLSRSNCQWPKGYKHHVTALIWWSICQAHTNQRSFHRPDFTGPGIRAQQHKPNECCFISAWWLSNADSGNFGAKREESHPRPRLTKGQVQRPFPSNTAEQFRRKMYIELSRLVAVCWLTPTHWELFAENFPPVVSFYETFLVND